MDNYELILYLTIKGGLNIERTATFSFYHKPTSLDIAYAMSDLCNSSFRKKVIEFTRFEVIEHTYSAIIVDSGLL